MDSLETELERAAYAGDFQTVKWLIENYMPSKDVVLPALGAACEKGHQGIASLISTQCAIAHDDVCRSGMVLSRACISGRTNIVRWVVQHFKLTPEDARANANIAFRHACMCGHMGIAQWLVQRFKLTADDARAWSNMAIREASGRGYLELVQWLVETFGLQVADMGPPGYATAFDWACIGGHMGVAKWLARHFGLSGALMSEYSVLSRTSANGYVRIVEWLLASFKWSDKEVCDAIEAAASAGHLHIIESHLAPAASMPARQDTVMAPLRAACQNGHMPVVEWLVNTHEPSADRIWQGDAAPMRIACLNGHMRIARWLTSHYNLTPDAVRTAFPVE